MTELDRHLTTEELSALLDDQPSTGETEENIYRMHLQDCEQCQLELADLRQTVRLLRSLPAPKLPRSFALPADISWEVPSEAEEKTTATSEPQAAETVTPAPISLPERRQQRVARRDSGRDWRPTLRLISSLVAVVGIFFMLSTLQLPHMGGSASSGTAASTTASSDGHNAPHAQNTAVGQSTPSTVNPNSHPPANGTTPGTTQQHPATMQPGMAQPQQPDPFQFLSFFAITSGPGRLRLGLLLLVIGGLGFYIFKQRYRYRWR